GVLPPGLSGPVDVTRPPSPRARPIRTYHARPIEILGLRGRGVFTSPRLRGEVGRSAATDGEGSWRVRGRPSPGGGQARAPTSPRCAGRGEDPPPSPTPQPVTAPRPRSHTVRVLHRPPRDDSSPSPPGCQTMLPSNRDRVPQNTAESVN